MKILNVEDDRTCRRQLEILAAERGHEYKGVMTYNEALDFVDKEQFDVAILDPNTSDSSTMSRFQPARLFARICQQLGKPTAYLSGSEFSEYRNGLPWFVKSTDLADVLEWIDNQKVDSH